MAERLHFPFSLSCTGEGNGNPLQCSCLENPRDGGAWWAAVNGVAQSRTRLKRLSSSSSRGLGAFVPLATSLWRYGCLQLPAISLLPIRVFTILFGFLWHCPPLANSPLVKDSPVALFAGNTSFQLEPQMIQEVGRLGGNRAPTNAHSMVVLMPRGTGSLVSWQEHGLGRQTSWSLNFHPNSHYLCELGQVPQPG